MACRGAIKAGDYLDPDERRRLLEKLKTTKPNIPVLTADRLTLRSREENLMRCLKGYKSGKHLNI